MFKNIITPLFLMVQNTENRLLDSKILFGLVPKIIDIEGIIFQDEINYYNNSINFLFNNTKNKRIKKSIQLNSNTAPLTSSPIINNSSD